MDLMTLDCDHEALEYLTATRPHYIKDAEYWIFCCMYNLVIRSDERGDRNAALAQGEAIRSEVPSDVRNRFDQFMEQLKSSAPASATPKTSQTTSQTPWCRFVLRLWVAFAISLMGIVWMLLMWCIRPTVKDDATGVLVIIGVALFIVIFGIGGVILANSLPSGRRRGPARRREDQGGGVLQAQEGAPGRKGRKTSQR